MRGDLRISDKDTVFARWSLDQAAFTALPLLPPGAQTGVTRDVPARSLGLGYTRLVTTAIVNEIRLAYNPWDWRRIGQPNVTVGAAAFGVIGSTARPSRQLQLGLKLLF